ncbi:MAG: hypothetical protein Hyperionvirus3_162 [Hyperionvirus sp.]|uniref:Nudix hydrolase domain-containing protein n=1 Tax=Hyperionvirus sp. TaxID=2487770 RepID=A0A3G5A6Y7_9VIRU|nr:MAG: hypothetical protein Hyperionvirus3_162 [Hyperionvirus sp.]
MIAIAAKRWCDVVGSKCKLRSVIGKPLEYRMRSPIFQRNFASKSMHDGVTWILMSAYLPKGAESIVKNLPSDNYVLLVTYGPTSDGRGGDTQLFLTGNVGVAEVDHPQLAAVRELQEEARFDVPVSAMKLAGRATTDYNKTTWFTCKAETLIYCGPTRVLKTKNDSNRNKIAIIIHGSQKQMQKNITDIPMDKTPGNDGITGRTAMSVYHIKKLIPEIRRRRRNFWWKIPN